MKPFATVALSLAFSITFISSAFCQTPPRTAIPYGPYRIGPLGVVLVVLFGLAVLVGIIRLWRSSHRGTEHISKPASRNRERMPSHPISGSAKTLAETQQGIKSLFISYRRQDSADITGRIYDGLVQHFGKTAVFKDVDSIPLGIDFREHLREHVGRCNILIAIIGKSWLVGGEGNKSRLTDVRDHLRIELETALQRNIPVIPVLVQGATIPQEDALPSSLRPLAYRNGISVRPDPDFHTDMDRLIRGVEAHFS